MTWIDALVPCFSSFTMMCNESESRSISQHIAYRGEAKEAVAALAPAECHCNDFSLTNPNPRFDDHTVRTEHHLQKRLRQRALMTVNGGHEILWRCSCCRKPWYQAGHSSFFVYLSNIPP